MNMQLYKLNTIQNSHKRRYTKEELQEMTTFQLKNICLEERIIKGIINNLDRDRFINTIFKYRGAKNNYFIKEYKEDGFEKLKEMLKKYLGTRLSNRGQIRVPAKITLYPEIGINEEDIYKVTIEGNAVEEGNVLLVNENNELCGIFNLVQDEVKSDLYYLVLEKNSKIDKSTNRNYNLLFFPKEASEYIYRTYYSEELILPTNLKYYEVPLLNLEIKELEETTTVLGIDFGTSNSTAGVYLGGNYVENPCYNDLLNERIKLNEINFVKFRDVSAADERWIEVLPTVVYVEDCSDPENIKYSFGYEAQQNMKRNDYALNASAFRGIKRWVNDYSKVEEIFDEEGNTACIVRGELIRVYIKHVIEMAEHQFKCRFKNLHISSPVKLKQQFIDMFKEIMPEYKMEEEEALDEGIAVLFNTIENQIKNDNFDEGEEYKALIIDCGGGTTDLSSCKFTIEEGHISYKININTTYENGDTNFGGNNITHRIMQFMKIIFASYYKNESKLIEIDNLIDIADTDIFRCVDEMGVYKIYENFEKNYAEAEKVIPTRFKEYENSSRDEYERIKNNFYFLWEIADNMKKEFFLRTNILRNKFDYVIKKEESDLIITTLRKWNLSIRINNEFENVYEFPKIIFNVKEINKLIKADIYEVVRKFLEKFYESRELQDYSIIKLTGQSCRIDIFKEALKEFVPGKNIEFRQKKEDNEVVSDLKLSCLRGALRYLNAKKIGEIEVTIKNEVPIVPYSVSAFTYNKQEKMLICCDEKLHSEKGFISRPLRATEVEFYLKNAEEKLKHKYYYKNNFNEYKVISEEELTETYYEKIYQDEIDTIRNGEIRFLFLPMKKAGDFMWFQ